MADEIKKEEVKKDDFKKDKVDVQRFIARKLKAVNRMSDENKKRSANARIMKNM